MDILKCRLLLFYTTTTNHFSIRLWHATKSEFYTTTSNDQLSDWTEKKLQSTFQSQTCTKKMSWSMFGGLLLVWSTTAFWIPVKALHLRTMLSKSMRYTENCNACSWHWSTGPNSSPWQIWSHVTTSASKVEQIVLRSFASSAIFICPLANQLLLFQAY